MSLQTLIGDLDRYAEFWRLQEDSEYQRYRKFVESTPDCCLRSHLEGHCTGSALISDLAGESVLLLFHPKLQRWLQPGGHADGDFDLLRVASREAFEETGLPLQSLKPFALGGQARIPLDLDIHPIPERGAEPSHFHYDLRYLLVTDSAQPLSPESDDMQLEWIPLAEVAQKTQEESVLRLVRKLTQLPVGAV